MGEHDGWRWQGRQYHGWFGSGTKPHEAGDRTDAVGTLAQRIATLPLTVVAALPPSKRHHRAARFDAKAAGDLVRAVSGWVSATGLGEAEFAGRCFGTGPDRPGIGRFRNAASTLATAATFGEMREAADSVAAGMLAVGLDQWPAVLRNAAARAGDNGTVTAVPGSGEVTRVFQIGSALLSGGSADLVAGLDDTVRGVSTPQILAVERKIEEIVEAVRNAANLLISDGVTPRALGILLHTMFKDAVEDAIKRGELPPAVRTEQTFANGVDKRYGEKGALRTDVILMEGNEVIAVWDYKTGAGPTISRPRIDELQGSASPKGETVKTYLRVLHIPFWGPGS